jgi:hypothetical protein
VATLLRSSALETRSACLGQEGELAAITEVGGEPVFGAYRLRPWRRGAAGSLPSHAPSGSPTYQLRVISTPTGMPT